MFATNHSPIKRIAFAGVLAGVAVYLQAAETSLIPTAAPQPVMRSLAQIDPRTPISSACSITTPGSYYLTGDITTLNSHGIQVLTNNVTLDLMGFTVSGNPNWDYYGVYVKGETNVLRSGVVIRNGKVTRFTTGVGFEYAESCTLENVSCVSNRTNGVRLYANRGACQAVTVRRCTLAESETGLGLSAGAGGRANHNRILDCQIVRNRYCGVIIDGNGGEASFNEIRRSQICGNLNIGVVLEGAYAGRCFGNTVSDSSIRENGDDGLYVTGISGSCQGNRIADCAIQDNLEYGIHFDYATNNVVFHNTLTGGGRSSVYAINSKGILTVLNQCMNNADKGFTGGSALVYGPLLDVAGVLATNGVSAHPWANFSR